MTLSDPTTNEILDALSVMDRSDAGLTRRRFLSGALALGAAGVGATIMPGMAMAGPPLGPQDRILVTLMMAGGNDGIGMIAPLNDGLFRSTRGALAGDPATAHAIDQGLYLDEYLPTIKSLYDEGSVACVLGVGNPEDDHSHFTSMATWMAGRPGQLPKSGWLGRYGQAAGFDELAMLSVGDRGIPLHLRTPGYAATAVSPTGRMYGVSENVIDRSQYDLVQANAVASGQPWLDAVSMTFSQSIDTARTLDPAYAVPSTADGLVRDMEVAAKMINLDIGARVLGVSLGGFDHHSGQSYPQGELMQEFDAAVAAFYATLDPAFTDRVAIMTFSEFGRSFTVNGSAGTDHGTASNLMVIGSNVKGGLYGQYPSLTDLDLINDFKHTVDYRSYYASVLEGWLGADSQSVLSGSFEDLGLFNGAGQPPGGGSGTATVVGSCLAFDGRFDITLVNAGDPAEFEVRVGSLPPRIRSLAAGESQTVTVTGRPEGDITITVLRNGVQIHSSVETVACDPAEPEVQIDQSCLAENGRVDVRFNNDSASSVTYSVRFEGLADRQVTVLANSKGKLTITGRQDRSYTVDVLRAGSPIASQEIVVSCDPPGPSGPGDGPVSVSTSCLSGSGRVDVYLLNNTEVTHSYDVAVGRLAPRSRTLAPKARGTVTVTGRANGPIDISVDRTGETIFTSTETISC